MKIAAKTQKARVYIRVSHVGKAREDTLVSDTMQLQEAKRYAAFMGFAFDEESSRQFADLDVSGFKGSWRDRPGIQAHFEAARRGEFNVLIFFKISRLGRNVREALDMIDAFEKLGVSFYFVAEKIDSSHAQGRFLRNILLAAAEMQSEDSSAFLKAAFRRRAEEGKVHGGAPPLWIARKGELYELIPDQVAAMRRLVALRKEGLGYVHLARRLHEEGFRTANGKHFTPSMTYKYLRADFIETMRGTAFFQRGKEDELRIPNVYPAILTDEEAEEIVAIQKVYSEDFGRKRVSGLDWTTAKRIKHGRFSASSIHLLSSLVFCPYCNRRMVANMRNRANGVVSYEYACPNRLVLRDTHPVGLKAIQTSILEDAVLRVVRGALQMPPEPLLAKPVTPNLDQRLQVLQAKIDRLVAMHLDGKLETADFTRLYQPLLEERESLLRSQTQDTGNGRDARIDELMGKAEPTRQELRQLMLLMVERVEAPFVQDGLMVRPGHPKERKLAKVTLRFSQADGARRFIVPLHRADYSGDRVYWIDSFTQTL